MIPYFEQPSFTIGGHTVYGFGILVFLGILVGVGVVAARGPAAGLGREEALNLAVWTTVWGLVGSHLFSEIAYYPERVRDDPLVLLRLWGTMSSFGGVAGGILGGAVLMKLHRKSRLEIARFLDAVAFAFPFAWIFGRAGCALAHDHIGIRSSHWLAVRFPEGPRFDLGLLELLYTLAVAGIFLVADRRRRPTGFFVGLFFVLYAPARFAMDELRVGEARYLGWTPSQYFCVATGIGGAALLVMIGDRLKSVPYRRNLH